MRTGPAGVAGMDTGDLTTMLTRKQFELLRFINERLKDTGVPPPSTK